MLFKRRSAYLLVVAIVLLYTFFPCARALAAAPAQLRAGGEDRYETAVEISKNGWDKADTAVLATGEDFPDALCAAPLAKKHNAPILLTGKGELNGKVSEEFKRLGVKEVLIIGGPGVISQSVEETIISTGINTTRIYGADRYETSLEIAKKIGTGSEVAIATGEYFPDALSIAPVAAMKVIPIILSDKEALSEKTKQYLEENKASKTYVIGGTGVISDNVYNELAPYSPVRLWGNDRYETNIEVLNKFLKDFNFSDIYVATGNDFPDALAGSALAPKTASPIILTDSTPAQATRDFMQNIMSSIKRIYALGGEGVITNAVLNRLIAGQSSTPYYTLIKENRYEYGATITVTNRGKTPVTNVSLELDLGHLNGSMYQREESLEVTGEGVKAVTDDTGNKKAMASLTSIESGQSVEYKIVRTFNNSGIRYNVDLSETSGDYKDFKEYLRYTSPEEKIESDDPAIIKKSAETIMDEKNPYKKAAKIFEYVNTSIDYDFSEANKGALNALKTGKGVCEDFAALFIAMARSVGIPSRMVTGYWIENVNLTSPEDASLFGHAWAEFYLPEFGWIVAEPTVIKTDLTKRVPAYEYFANLNDPGHFIRGYKNVSLYSMKYFTDGNADPDVDITVEEYIKKL